MEKVNKPTGAARKVLLWGAYLGLRSKHPLTCSRLLAQWAREQVDNIPVGSVGGVVYFPGDEAWEWLERYAPSLPPVVWELEEVPTGEVRDDWPYDEDDWILDRSRNRRLAQHGAIWAFVQGHNHGNRKGWFCPALYVEVPTGASRGAAALYKRQTIKNWQEEYVAGTYHKAEYSYTLRVKVASTGRVLAEDSIVSREGEWREVVRDYLLDTVLDTLRKLFAQDGEECHGAEVVRALSLLDHPCPPLEEEEEE